MRDRSFIRRDRPFIRHAGLVGALGLAIALAGCPGNDADVGGGGNDRNVVAEPVPGGTTDRDVATERTADRLALDWGTNLVDDKRNLAEGLARAAWVQSNLAAGEWGQAGEDLAVVHDRVQDLVGSQNLPMDVRNRMTVLVTDASALAEQIARREPAALEGASRLVSRYSDILNERAVLVWMGGPQGGGAGGMAPAPAPDRSETAPDRSETAPERSEP